MTAPLEGGDGHGTLSGGQGNGTGGVPGRRLQAGRVVAGGDAAQLRPTGDFADSTPAALDLPVSGLGDQAPPGFTFTVTAKDVLTMAFITYLWRGRNVVAGLTASDALGDITHQTVLDVAKRIDFRAERASGRRWER